MVGQMYMPAHREIASWHRQCSHKIKLKLAHFLQECLQRQKLLTPKHIYKVCPSVAELPLSQCMCMFLWQENLLRAWSWVPHPVPDETGNVKVMSWWRIHFRQSDIQPIYLRRPQAGTRDLTSTHLKMLNGGDAISICTTTKLLGLTLSIGKLETLLA